MVGEAAAAKYTGALFGAFGVLGALFAADRSLRSWKAPAALAGGFAAIAAPWYAWTVHTTGDPIYPLATSVFGNRRGLWTADEIQFQYFVARSYVGSSISEIVNRALSFLRGEALGGDIPLHRSPLSWLLGGGFLGLLIPSAWRDRTFLGSALSCLLCLGFTIKISADPRYLVPAVGLFALCAGLAADNAIAVAGRLISPSPRLRQAALVAWALVVVVIMRSSVGYARGVTKTDGLPPTSTAKISGFVGARIPCYPAVQYLNARFGSHYRAWGYICEEARYFAKGTLISDVFSTGSRLRVFDAAGQALPSDRTLWRRLKPLDVQWLILPTQTVTRPSVMGAHGLFALVAKVGPEFIFRVQ
jgi:hypothetical protein